MKTINRIGAGWVGLLLGMSAMTRAWAETVAAPASYESISASRAAETQEFLNRKKALQELPAGPQRDLQLKQEVLRHQAEYKKLSMQQEAIRRETINGLKEKWSTVEKDWKAECERHKAARTELEKLPEGPERAAKIEAENVRNRTTSKQIAVERNVVHEGVMQQANREVTGGATNVSNEVKQTAGTKVTDPNHRGMNGDLDAGGGYRTTEKAANILDEIGVKDPAGGRVKVKNGVLETNGDFGMTVNVDAGADRVGSSGHQAQVKQSAANAETYVSETGGAVQSQTLKDDLATLDHSKKAAHGLNEPPGKLVGTPEGQGMVKGALKSADQACLPKETVEAIARKNGIADPENLLDRMAEIKTGKAPIANAEEAAKLQGASRDIIEASQAATKAKAEVEIKNTKAKVIELEAQGKTAEAQRLRNEVADYNAKADASNKALAEAKHGPQPGKETPPKSTSPVAEPPPAETPGTAANSKPKPTPAAEPAVATKGTGTQPKVHGEPVPKMRGEPAPKTTAGGKVLGAAGLALGAYGIYEGYKTASEEMEAKKQGEPKGVSGWTANKAELAGRTLWHGLGFGAAAQIGEKAGKDSLEQYKKDIAEGKVAPDSVISYGWMKTRGVLGGLYGGVKAISYDAAKSSGTSLGEAVGETVGVGKDIYDLAKNSRTESQAKAEQSKKVYDTLIKNGASPVGAQRAADGVLQGDFTEAKRLTKVLDGKRAAALAATPKPVESDKQPGKPVKEDLAKVPAKLTKEESARQKALADAKARDGLKEDLTKSPATLTKEEAARQKALADAKAKDGLKEDPTKVPADPSKEPSDIVKALNIKDYVKGKLDEKAKGDLKKDPALSEEDQVKAALAAKDKEVAELRDGIAKTRDGLAKLRALRGLPGGFDDEGTIAQVEAALASMTARYQELTSGALGANPVKPAAKPPPETPTQGGTVTHADGSRTVLTYRQDASGKKVPVTTEYDRNGRIVRQTTVDAKGQSVPVPGSTP